MLGKDADLQSMGIVVQYSVFELRGTLDSRQCRMPQTVQLVQACAAQDLAAIPQVPG